MKEAGSLITGRRNGTHSGWLPEWNQGPKTLLAKPEPSPQKGRDVGRKEDVAEQRIPDANLRGDRAAEMTGQEDRSEHSRPRKCVKRQTYELHDSDSGDHVLRIAELDGALDRDGKFQDLDYAVKQQEQDGERAEHEPGPASRRVGRHARHHRRRMRALFCIETTTAARREEFCRGSAR